MNNRVILIAGPTASGKSSLALRLAEKTGGTIINADSMQVYSELQLLSARPSAADLDRAPHLLYGFRAGNLDYSVQHWIEDVAAIMRTEPLASGPAIIVGGTGLYFSALTGGLSPVPEIDPEIRGKWRTEQRQAAAADLHRQLADRDPLAAAQIRESDSQRIVRALEVFDSTGKSLIIWQQQAGTPLVKIEGAVAVQLQPARDWLHQRINHRFEQMVADGALAEVQQLRQLAYADDSPVMKAIGVAELTALIDGELSEAQAIERAAARTRQYAKRQYTWLRNQLSVGWTVASDPQSAAETLLNL